MDQCALCITAMISDLHLFYSIAGMRIVFCSGKVFVLLIHETDIRIAPVR